MSIVNYEHKSINDKIIEWTTIDKQLKMLNEQQKLLRSKKNQLNNDICQYMKKTNNNKININNNTLKIIERKEYSPLTFQYIESSLEKICNKQEVIRQIITTLKENRTIKVYDDIRHV